MKLCLLLLLASLASHAHAFLPAEDELRAALSAEPHTLHHMMWRLQVRSYSLYLSLGSDLSSLIQPICRKTEPGGPNRARGRPERLQRDGRFCVSAEIRRYGGAARERETFQFEPPVAPPSSPPSPYAAGTAAVTGQSISFATPCFHTNTFSATLQGAVINLALTSRLLVMMMNHRPPGSGGLSSFNISAHMDALPPSHPTATPTRPVPTTWIFTWRAPLAVSEYISDKMIAQVFQFLSLFRGSSVPSFSPGFKLIKVYTANTTRETMLLTNFTQAQLNWINRNG